MTIIEAIKKALQLEEEIRDKQREVLDIEVVESRLKQQIAKALINDGHQPNSAIDVECCQVIIRNCSPGRPGEVITGVHTVDLCPMELVNPDVVVEFSDLTD